MAPALRAARPRIDFTQLESELPTEPIERNALAHTRRTVASYRLGRDAEECRGALDIHVGFKRLPGLLQDRQPLRMRTDVLSAQSLWHVARTMLAFIRLSLHVVSCRIGARNGTPTVTYLQRANGPSHVLPGGRSFRTQRAFRIHGNALPEGSLAEEERAHPFPILYGTTPRRFCQGHSWPTPYRYAPCPVLLPPCTPANG